VNGRALESASSRQERKQRTRQALLDAALALLEHESFSALSLRQVTRSAGIVPTAFYRHFDDMEELGLALIDESFRTLRAMARAVRVDPLTSERMIHSSVAILVEHVHQHEGHFRFVARERFGGVAALRLAIRGEVRLFAGDLATDLARLGEFAAWGTEDLQLLAAVMVNTMVATAEAILDTPPEDSAAVAEIAAAARRQLRMVTLGVGQWHSDAADRRPSAAGAVPGGDS
jgi:AcrR family transcriptional regulator